MPERTPKTVNYELISQEEHADLYGLMEDLIAAHHDHLLDANIALMWRKGWKADKDGHVRLGECRKASDLNHQLHNYDFVILLNREVWHSVEFSPTQRRALLDHELTHAAVDFDDDGEPRVNEDGERCWRIRKHDIEEFRDVVARNGLWKKDLEDFAQATMDAKTMPLLAAAERLQAAGHPLGETLIKATQEMIEVDREVSEIERKAREAANDPKVRRAIRDLAPKPGSGITAVTIESGGRKVTLTPEDRQRMTEQEELWKGKQPN